MIGQDVLFSHGVSDDDPKNHWVTPTSVFRPLHLEFGFTLDAAATKQSRVVPNYLGPGSWLARDAFTADWREFAQGGAAWLNPPYGRGIDRWMKLAKYWGQYMAVVTLVMARTDTRWWHDYVFDGADEVRFRKGRIRFERPDGAKAGAAPAPSALVVYRPHIQRSFPKVTAWVP